MKISSGTVIEILTRLRSHFQYNTSRDKDNPEEPFRAEIYSAEVLAQQGEFFAKKHEVAFGKTKESLLNRLANNEVKLLEVRDLMVKSIRFGKQVTPAAEWMLDNFYLIEEQIILAKRHLPKGYSQGLPYLTKGDAVNLPRVYDIVLEVIAHSDGRVDALSLTNFIASYQKHSQLTLGELWAVPIMLRLAIIENIRRIGSNIALDMIDHDLAEFWAEKMLVAMKEDPGNLVLEMADMIRSKPILDGPFVAEFIRKLKGHGSSLSLPLNWVEDQLLRMGVSATEMVALENKKLASNQISVKNSINTLRFIGANDWKAFVENLSCVEAVLREDLTGIYPLMDFTTRDSYRHVVEKIAKFSDYTEAEVAKIVVGLAGKQHEVAPHNRKAQIGYYLIDKGIEQTRAETKARMGLRDNLVHLFARMPVTIYGICILVLTLLFAGVMSYIAFCNGAPILILPVIAVLLSLAGAWQLAISMVNWVVTILIKPKLLPKMDFSKKIPEQYRTLVVIPTMLNSIDYIETLLETLEIRYLANSEANIHYALLTDFKDAATEHLPGDAALVSAAMQGVAALNEKYNQGKNGLFSLFHRPRVWSKGEGKWMGFERKRGKLGALNALLRGKDAAAFSVVIADVDLLQHVKYVITLDSDTQMPREVARKMIATMAHPLNHAVFNENLKRVTHGYGILQPRVATAIPKEASSLYLQLEGNDIGIDPYTHVSSDVYQDLFWEGSFIGKGIYDVDIFEKSIKNAFPENRILSHDLLEGCYTRSGLLSDVLLYEESPAQYLSDVKRHHRWIRGDWQIGAWMMPFVTNAKNKLVRNNLSALSRWKILDNLRRSLLPLALLLLLLFGWTVMPYAAFWTLFVTFIITLPVISATLWQLVHKPKELKFNAHLSEVAIALRNIVYRFLFGLAVLPFQAYKNLDAILRVHWRMIFSKKKLLEWTPSDIAASEVKNTFTAIYLNMWIAPALSIVLALFLSSMHPLNFLIATPILILWFLAPALTWRLSLPLKEDESGLSEKQLLFLHTVSRKTWAYFETFVNEKEHWLPPDNYQEQPVAVVAQRTSPTNLGLNLLANLTAYDFGYISMKMLLYRTDRAMKTMDTLERYEGHFYNWYDTQTTKPLSPRYVSTVDSGNLIGHLLTLRQGLLLLQEQPAFNTRIFQGIHTTARIVEDILVAENSNLLNEWRVLEWFPEGLLVTPVSFAKALSEIADKITLFREKMKSANLKIDWFDRLEMQVAALLSDLEETLPWIKLFPVPEKCKDLELLDNFFSIQSFLEQENAILENMDRHIKAAEGAEHSSWLITLRECFTVAAINEKNKAVQIAELAALCEKFSDVNYDFLYNPALSQFRIGFNVDDQRKDESYYDLLASEVRLAVFTAIAQGKVPQESWFSLGRLLTQSGGDPILLSWSGSMFEYLMPQLVMPSYDKTLLQQTNKAMVKRQIDYANQRAVPWGISESAYNAVDANLNYQYRAFGVPGLGMKRGLEDDLVIAPYASMMALMILPQKACNNLELLSHIGFEGEYGFYEAVDYTQSRLPGGYDEVLIKSFMVHHQGMGFLSLSYLLLNKPMQERFVNDPRFQGTLLLLQERIPRASVFNAHTPDALQVQEQTNVSGVRNIYTAQTSSPEVQLLSNGNYHVMITNTGSGYSRWHNLALTRWREDALMDGYGIFCYIKDVNAGNYWSNTIQPTLKNPDKYEVLFSPGHVQFERQDNDLITKTEIVVSPEDDTELRKVRITNRSSQTKTIELTTYAEVVLASQASDEAHQAFSNLFVQSEILEEQKAILCTRRPRSSNEQPPWMFHLMDVYGGIVFEGVSYETDRRKFIGRGQSLAEPAAMSENELSGSKGAVLDPIMSIRYRFTIKAGHTAVIDIVHGVSDTRENCLSLMHKYRDHHIKKRPFEIFMTHSQAILRQIDASEADVQLYDRLAGAVLFANSNLRASLAVRKSNFRGQSGLWSHSISGDFPIVLLHIIEGDNIEIVRQLMQAHSYWRLKGLVVDLVIWNENKGAYRQELQQEIMGMIAHEQNNNNAGGKQGGVFLKLTDQLSQEDRILFESIARVIIYDNEGTLMEQVAKTDPDMILPPALELHGESWGDESSDLSLPHDLHFNNELGGFAADGKSYKILTTTDSVTPAPWVNILANPQFGTVVSESGSAYTWSENAHEYRLTPWNNDATLDAGAEAFYIRDEQSGDFWSPSPFPVKSKRNYITTHGFGYSTFEHVEHQITSLMTVFVHESKPIKFVAVKLRNTAAKSRKFSVFGYAEITLGDVRSKTNTHVVAEKDAVSGTLLFRNRYNSVFSDRVCYFTASNPIYGYTTDRTEFVGRNTTLANPAALLRKKLSNRVDTGKDACAALQILIDIPPGEEVEVLFQMGSSNDLQEIINQVHYFKPLNAMHEALSAVKQYWKNLVEIQQVQTPDNALNILSNGWLVYQTLASRMNARSGFYQSGGAFGFRDQLQDVLALLHAAPQLARAQICMSASRQFEEGDVQHWWHPPLGAGVRTKCSDDLLWLPFAVINYIDVTGDKDVLNEQIGYLRGSQLNAEQDSIYEVPQLSDLNETLYRHCVRSIQKSLIFGKHGLPLIGTGDWNDGMDKVGEHGIGESVWLAFFLFDILNGFELVAKEFGDDEFAAICRNNALALQNNINENAWDGNWYKRAWFDDGHALGSKENEECRIDSISQSWSVLSGAATESRGLEAMASLDKYLVDRDIRIIKLLDPAFDSGNLNPGYIKGYVPGIRENGGQYSHAAIWSLMAFAKLGNHAKVYELFSLIQPVSHSSTKAAAAVYKVEPYVMAADVYANESHLGMGGWTWYTGSAGWLYQFIISGMIGLSKEGNALRFKPCFPLEWPYVNVSYRFGTSVYQITIKQVPGIAYSYWQEGKVRTEGNVVPLVDDGAEHEVAVFILLD